MSRALALLASRGDPVKQSTLSRYVDKYADALKPERRGREVTIDFETLVEHRAQNIHRDAGTAASPSESDAAGEPTKRAGRADEAALNIRAQRQMRELELAERVNLVTPTREVEEAALAAVSALKNAFALALNDTAEAIANVVNVEPRVVRPHLRAFEKKGLNAFVGVLADHTAQREPAPAPADG
jgi:hypothetical protein